MQNKKLLVRTFVFVLFIVGGIWLITNGIDRVDSPQIKENSARNFIEEKLESLKKQKEQDLKEQEELANQRDIKTQDKIIKEEIDHKTSESKEVLVDVELKTNLINLIAEEMYMKELYKGRTSDYTEIYDFDSNYKQGPKHLKEASKVDLYLGNESQQTWTIDEFNEVIERDQIYNYVATKDAQHIYGFYLDGDKSFADIYKTSLDMDKQVLFTYVKTIGFEQEIDQVYALDEVIIFEIMDEDSRKLIFSDLECVPITGAVISEDLNIEDIVLGAKDDNLTYTIIGSENDMDLTYSGPFYYGKYTGHHIMVVENEVYENGQPIDDYLKNSDEDAREYFINTYTNELITFDSESRLIDRSLIPAKILEKSEDDYNNFYLALNYWGILKKGMIFKNNQDIYYYEYKTKDFTLVDKVDARYLRYAQANAYLGAYFYWEEATKYYKFDEDSKSFVLRSDQSFEYEANTWLGEYYVYDDVMYFYDGADVVGNAREDMKRFPDMKPISETPDISYKGQPVFITTTLKVNETEYIRTMVDGLLGTVKEGEFTPIIKGPVNRYDCSESGIAYTDHSKINKAFYYNLTNHSTLELSVDGQALDIQIIDSYVYVLVDNRKVYRFNTKGSGASKLTADISLDAKDLVNKERDMSLIDPREKRYTRLDDNNDYLVFMGSLAGATLILDKDLNLYDSLTGTCDFITEDGYIYYGVVIYYSRYSISTKEDSLIHESYFKPILYYNGKVMFNSSYEGPGPTYLKNFYDEEKEFFNKDVDISIEIAHMHATRIVIYDHKLKQLDLLISSSGDVEYELTEEGLYYWIDGSTDRDFYPFTKNSRVEIYSAKRV